MDGLESSVKTMKGLESIRYSRAFLKFIIFLQSTCYIRLHFSPTEFIFAKRGSKSSACTNTGQREKNIQIFCSDQRWMFYKCQQKMQIWFFKNAILLKKSFHNIKILLDPAPKAFEDRAIIRWLSIRWRTYRLLKLFEYSFCQIIDFHFKTFIFSRLRAILLHR